MSNTRRMNITEELGRVDAEKAFTKKGKKNLKAEKKRIIRELKAKDGARALKKIPPHKKKSLGKLPRKVRNKMGFMKSGGRAGFGSGGAAIKGMGCEIK